MISDMNFGVIDIVMLGKGGLKFWPLKYMLEAEDKKSFNTKFDMIDKRHAERIG